MIGEVTVGSLLVARPGRPTRAATRSDRRVNFRITDEEYGLLKELAKGQKQPMASVIRDAVNTYCNDMAEDQAVFRGRQKPAFE